MIAATLPLWPKLPRHQRGEDGTRSRGSPSTVTPELKHVWVKGRNGQHCRNCLKPALAGLPSFKQVRERCRGRANCLAERASKEGHELLETSCRDTPLFICSKCGAWAEYRIRASAAKCKGALPKRTRTSLKRVAVGPHGMHPKLDLGLDRPPTAYRFDENHHGPSRGTLAARRLTRRLLARVVPWAEEHQQDILPPVQLAEDAGEDPSADEEAEAFFAQEEYWDSLSYDPFAGLMAQADIDQEDDAEGFWGAIPA